MHSAYNVYNHLVYITTGRNCFNLKEEVQSTVDLFWKTQYLVPCFFDAQFNWQFACDLLLSRDVKFLHQEVCANVVGLIFSIGNRDDRCGGLIIFAGSDYLDVECFVLRRSNLVEEQIYMYVCI